MLSLERPDVDKEKEPRLHFPLRNEIMFQLHSNKSDLANYNVLQEQKKLFHNINISMTKV